MEAAATATGPALTRRAALAQERAARALQTPPFWPPLAVPPPARAAIPAPRTSADDEPVAEPAPTVLAVPPVSPPAPRSRREALARERAGATAEAPAAEPPAPLTRREALARERAAAATGAPAHEPAHEPAQEKAPPLTRREALARERAAGATEPPTAPVRLRVRGPELQPPALEPPVVEPDPTPTAAPTPATYPSRRSLRTTSRARTARRRPPARALRPLGTAAAVVTVAFASAQAHQQVLRAALPVAPDPRDVLRHAAVVVALSVVALVLHSRLDAAGRGPWSRAVPWLVCLGPPLTLLAAATRGVLDVPPTLWMVLSQPGLAACAVLVATTANRPGWTRGAVLVTAGAALTWLALVLALGERVADGAAGEALVVRTAVVGMLLGAALLATAHPRDRRPRRPSAWLRPLAPTGPTLALAVGPTLVTDPTALQADQLWSLVLVPGASVAAAGAAVLGSHALLLLRERPVRRHAAAPEPPAPEWSRDDLAALREEGGWWVSAERPTLPG